MKKCSYCGLEHPDDATRCIACHQDFAEPSPSAAGERRFWERMTFKQFTILFLRLQAVWLLFYAAIDVTYLPVYFIRLDEGSRYSPILSEARLGFFMSLLRVVMNVVAALAVMLYSEKVVNWFARDLVSKQPSLSAPSTVDRPD
jgi:hypothetical protein